MKKLTTAIGHHCVLKPFKGNNRDRKENLIKIATFANTANPFYRNKFTSFLQSAQILSDDEFYYAFSHLPITTKQDLRENNEHFASDHLKYKVDLLADGKMPTFWEILNHGILKKDFSASLSTGGTSGMPTYRWIDYDDANIFAQSFLHSFKLNGWKTGEDFVVFYPLKSYFTAAYANNAKMLRRFFGFTMVPFEDLSKEAVIGLLETLRATKASLLVVFPCVLQRIAEIMRAENIPPFENLPYINVSGEFFMDCSKSFIQTMFPDSDIQSTYGAVEFGEIAHQKGLNSFDYNVFPEYVYLEQGADNSLLVTSYHQRAFPLIRYRIEDMGQVVNNEDGTQSLKNLEGKNADYLIGADGYMYFASFFNTLVNNLNRDFSRQIIHFNLRHSNNDGYKTMQANFVLLSPEKSEEIKKAALDILSKVFANYDAIDIQFPQNFHHDYTRKFKIIGEGDGLAEVVGGYHQRKAS